ncbi:hypothetical protein FOA43_002814 [Brettanomyces nanus]|uniref:Uncharacterized protein n=1 Tax=Eeniella nana TaxID=13502 RepID=A0A875S6W7_EENNA|nr:uncharacterized protein FOA43_002814 [Brettanomyces nanus]QPG75459.1 hypothetical protein FOA43_002814 [Brettanomyces nanus]
MRDEINKAQLKDTVLTGVGSTVNIPTDSSGVAGAPGGSAASPSSPGNSLISPGVRALLQEWSSSPYPALGFSGALAVIPTIRPVISQVATSFKKKPVLLSPYPSNLSVLFFGGFVGLGGFLIYDHDVENGSALTSAWSLMYVLANGKRSLLTFRLYPKVLALLALANSGVYGGRFLGLL